ncbi:uncharacterized protein CTRU02_208697 [Colletotrichum truncatum]|uniref:Uncharacterized protein n=1 Tax=Colletotrichum truncatum TaxID=5467 RepID=A0ACC3YZL5_COLTU
MLSSNLGVAPADRASLPKQHNWNENGDTNDEDKGQKYKITKTFSSKNVNALKQNKGWPYDLAGKVAEENQERKRSSSSTISNINVAKDGNRQFDLVSLSPGLKKKNKHRRSKSSSIIETAVVENDTSTLVKPIAEVFEKKKKTKKDKNSSDSLDNEEHKEKESQSSNSIPSYEEVHIEPKKHEESQNATYIAISEADVKNRSSNDTAIQTKHEGFLVQKPIKTTYEQDPTATRKKKNKRPRRKMSLPTKKDNGEDSGLKGIEDNKSIASNSNFAADVAHTHHEQIQSDRPILYTKSSSGYTFNPFSGLMKYSTMNSEPAIATTKKVEGAEKKPKADMNNMPGSSEKNVGKGANAKDVISKTGKTGKTDMPHLGPQEVAMLTPKKEQKKRNRSKKIKMPPRYSLSRPRLRHLFRLSVLLGTLFSLSALPLPFSVVGSTLQNSRRRLNKTDSVMGEIERPCSS